MTQPPSAAETPRHAITVSNATAETLTGIPDMPFPTQTIESSPYPSLSPCPETPLASLTSPACPAYPRSPRESTTLPSSANLTDAPTGSGSDSNLETVYALDPASGSDHGTFSATTDGLTDRLFRQKNKEPIAAVFIHAGAGFHSIVNESSHLEVCSQAAQLAMKFLKAGGSAIDAVEAAIKCLEDKEITNAGYGSNLSIDGVVEGDATIVDYLGRSGACGAVPMIKNPISLARLILDKSQVPLSLRRIPPNILVGNGAKRFAEEHGMRSIDNERLISVNARDRFYRWRQDLLRAEMLAIKHQRLAKPSVAISAPPAPAGPQQSMSSAVASPRNLSTEEATPGQSKQAGTATSMQDKAARHERSQARETTYLHTPPRHDAPASQLPGGNDHTAAEPSSKRLRLGCCKSDSFDDASIGRRRATNSGDGCESSQAYNSFQSIIDSMYLRSERKEKALSCLSEPGFYGKEPDSDIITDTVGAIAVDLQGRIAAGSSSGGIGMKHCGRIGPAALVGIGTAVFPADPMDSSGKCVAAVTSGTGEHMATTIASHKCAERLYYNERRGEGGRHITEYDEDYVMKSFVVDDFMNHPGVKNQISGGAIGVMAVKKTNKGVYFYFAHNTDSFALASMASNEQEPLVVMSRLGRHEGVSSGGRRIKLQ